MNVEIYLSVEQTQNDEVWYSKNDLNSSFITSPIPFCIYKIESELIMNSDIEINLVQTASTLSEVEKNQIRLTSYVNKQSISNGFLAVSPLDPSYPPLSVDIWNFIFKPLTVKISTGTPFQQIRMKSHV